MLLTNCLSPFAATHELIRMSKWIFLTALIALSGLFSVYAAFSGHDYGVINLGKACTFLQNQYVVNVGLLKTAILAEPDAHIAYINDNILAVRALVVCGDYELADNILSTLTNKYVNYLRTGRHEVLIGQIIPETPRTRVDVPIVHVGNITVLAEIEGSKILNNWEEYADWLFMEAINSLLKGDRAASEDFFTRAMNMFDGYGFRDAAFNDAVGMYDTYKLALAIYVYRALGEPTNYRDTMTSVLSILMQSQDQETGGIYTAYSIMDDKPHFGKDISDRNVETTSIVILALYSDLPSSIRNNNCYDTSAYAPAIVVIIALIAALCILMKLKRK